MKDFSDLEDISKLIINMFGLHFPSSQYNDFERRIKSAARDIHIEPNLSSIKSWLLNSVLTNQQLNILSSHLTVGETYFFREEPAIEFLIKYFFPEIIKQRKGKNEEIKIWSAGCSSGEEPYTIAIIIKEFFPILMDWKIQIIASDINTIAIQKALQGEYTEWSFRETDSDIKHKYFLKSGKNWKINSEIKKMMTFTYLNLSKNNFPSTASNIENFDIIFCRNVMMYFLPGIIKEVSDRLYNSLNDDGWLITSMVELNDEYFSKFKRVQFNNGIFYQKTVKSDNAHGLNIFINKEIKHLTKNKKIIKKIKIPIKDNKPKKTNNHDHNSQNLSYEIDKLFQKGEYQKCIDLCLKLFEQNKLDSNIYYYLLKSYRNKGIHSEDEKTIKKVLSESVATTEMYYLYASFLFERNYIDEAEVFIKKAIYQNHKHVLSHILLGNIQRKNEKKDMALKYYQIAMKLIDEYNNDEILTETDGLTIGMVKEFTLNLIKTCK